MLAVAWVALAPVPVGGSVTYVIVNGNSMEPKFHLRDLVIVRGRDSYQVGNIVAYRHPEIGPVIHRIVEREGDRFVLRGDNNHWLDSYRPRESELIGKSWIHVPSAGKLIERLRGPGGLAVLSGIMGVMAMTMFVTTKDARPQPRRVQTPAEKKGVGLARPPGGGAEGMLTTLAAVMLASLLLGFFAFSRPASLPTSENAGYQHTGEFSYSARDMPYGIYDRSEAQTGEPVFRRLTDTVNVGFDYRLVSDHPTDGVEGTYRLVAEVSDVNGWKRTILLEPEARFTGGEFTATGVLDLSEVQSVITRLEKQTGLHTDRYAVSIVPEVSTRGTLAGQRLDDEFSPRLDFWLDPLQLQLQIPTTAGVDAPQSPGITNLLNPSQEGSTKLSGTQPNTLPILGLDLSVPMARFMSLLGLALSVGGLVWIGVPMLRAFQGDEPTRIRTRYGPLLVSLNSGDPAVGGHLIEVASFEDLAKVAERGGQSILHRTSDGIHDYYVQDLGATYHYRAAASEPEDTLVAAGQHRAT